MAITVSSGELKHKLVFKQPVSSLNNEGGQEVSYLTAFSTFAKVDTFNQFRSTEADVTGLTTALNFYIRHAIAREAIDKDWLIEYNGDDYVIHVIEPIEQKQKFIRLTAKSRGTVVTSGFSSGVANWTDFTFDDLTGEMLFTGTEPGDYYTITDFKNVPNDGSNYINGEGVAFSIGSFTGDTAEGVTYFTPGQAVVKWKRITGPPSYASLTEWSEEKILTITRLQRRWYHIYRIVTLGTSSQAFDLFPGFTNAIVENIAGVDMGTYSDIDVLIADWNADPANDGFPIIGYRTINGFYEVQFEPDADKTGYPIQYITYHF